MNAVKYRSVILAAAVFLTSATPAWAWHGKGHYDATLLALRAVRTDGNLPAFFHAGADTVAHSSLDPDNFTRPIAPDVLHRAESPEHFFDIELLADANMPANRYEFIDLCYRRKLKPNRVGLLPYAVTEWTQRLTVALAEHRKYPENPAIRAKCLLHAGMLAHYAADLCQPLHVTIHYDGRVTAGGKSPRSGIHAKVDALLGKLTGDANAPSPRHAFDANALLTGLHPVAFEAVLPAAMAELRKSSALVDLVYELEKQIPAEADPIAPGSRVEKFSAERMRAAAGFIASLYLTAWRDSAAIKLPWWYRRPYNPPGTAAP